MKQCELTMLLSLYETINKVGGNPKTILTEGLTVTDLIKILAPNGVIFAVKQNQ